MYKQPIIIPRAPSQHNKLRKLQNQQSATLFSGDGDDGGRGDRNTTTWSLPTVVYIEWAETKR